MEIIQRDVVIVGTGVAGLSAALGLDASRLTVITKTGLGEGGSSPFAQGGVAAAIGREDSPALHREDTLRVGAGLSDPAVVDLLTREAPDRIRYLVELGARLDREPGGGLALGREAGHSRRRILHASGDRTGAELVRTLTEAVRRLPSIEVVEQTFAIDLALADGRVVGVSCRTPDGETVCYLAPAVVLATGGIGRAYLHTTNPPELTGDGLAMAARAGARLIDLEFVQFHPTGLASGKDPMPLLTEALRGEGAILVDSNGRRFMTSEHADAELAPRDIVARAVWRQQAAGRQVFLDATKAIGQAFPTRFPTVFELCQAEGIDPRLEPVPVSPAAHYHMGGIEVDEQGRTSLPGLWAAGEVSCTGVHGANRLASNSLLEALVFGTEVAEDIRRTNPRVASRGPLELPKTIETTADPDPVVAELRQLMWDRVGLERDEQGLASAIDRIDELRAINGPAVGEARNLLAVGRLVAGAARYRRESRGSHFRTDFPEVRAGTPSRVSWVEGSPQAELVSVA